MTRRLIVNNRCPLCGEPVEMVRDAVLKQNPHEGNAELVITKRGYPTSKSMTGTESKGEKHD